MKSMWVKFTFAPSNRTFDSNFSKEQPMSPHGYERTFSRPKSTSALTPKADVLVAVTDFRV